VDSQGFFRVTGLQFLDGLEDRRFVNFVDLKSGSDSFEQSNRQLPAEMFAKFFEALKDAVVKTEQAAVNLDVKPFEHYTPGLETRAIPRIESSKM